MAQEPQEVWIMAAEEHLRLVINAAQVAIPRLVIAVQVMEVAVEAIRPVGLEVGGIPPVVLPLLLLRTLLQDPVCLLLPLRLSLLLSKWGFLLSPIHLRRL
jgi:hypothetical protein